MGASMSAVTPISQNAGDIGTEYVGISPPAVGAKIGAAAPASHVHRVLASSSQITGFGRMLEWQYPVARPNGGANPMGYLFSRLPQSIPAEWTAELFFSIPVGSYQIQYLLLGWSAADGSVPYDGGWIVGTGTDTGHFMGTVSGGSAYWGANQSSATNVPAANPVVAQHYFVQMDKAGNMWCGINGNMAGPFAPPAGAVFYTTGFRFVGICGDFPTAPGSACVDEVRFSSELRYPTSGAAYNVPAAPFDPDASTSVLWHLDDVPYGQFLASNGDGQGVFVFATVTTADSTVNGVVGVFAINDIEGQSTGNPFPAVMAGGNSNVAPGSGSGAAQTVESVQGQTGNFLFVDPGGNVIPVANPNGAQEIQVVSHLIGSPEYWLERVY